MDKIGQLLDTTKLKCKEKQEEAKRLTGGLKPSDGDRFPYKAKFDRLPDSIAELREKIDDLEGQLSCMQSNDENALIEEFEERQRQIKHIQLEIKNHGKSHEDIEKKIDQLHNLWYPLILAILNTINENFSSFMRSMGCAGEVDLIRGHEVRTTSATRIHSFTKIHQTIFSATMTNMELKFASNIEQVNDCKHSIGLFNRAANEP